MSGSTDAEDNVVWVLLDSAGLIVAAAAEDGDPAEAVRFLGRPRKGHRIVRVDGPVRMGAHIDAPMVHPPVTKTNAPLFAEKE